MTKEGLKIELKNEVLPECAMYKGTFIDNHNTTYEEWIGVSGKIYKIILKRSWKASLSFSALMQARLLNF